MNEGKRVFTAEDELRYQTVHSAKLSPDGKQVVFSVKKNDLESEKHICICGWWILKKGIQGS